ncbi:MAG: hypothetical protein KatS3mg124_1420 [Porticoccaceae bacterium]|nr:MAG: hypothetical protein KatS3mg124_1420 [Porticoccaceae bacterium]
MRSAPRPEGAALRREALGAEQAATAGVAMALFALLLCLFAAIHWAAGDARFAGALLLFAAAVAAGLAVHRAWGFSSSLALYYAAIGCGVFLFVVAQGGSVDRLLALPGMLFGFLVVLGTRLAAGCFALLAAGLALLFASDAYLAGAEPLPPLAEARFFTATVGIAALALWYAHRLEGRWRRLAERVRALEEAAFRDPATGLIHHRALGELAAARFFEWEREGHPCALVFFALDDFAELRARCGAALAEEVLLQVATLLRQGLRGGDLAGRWGDADFLLLLPGQDGAGARAVAERLRGELKGLQVVFAGRPIGLSASFGVAGAERALAAEDLVALAEAALRRAQRAGGDRVEVAA